ncbi:hypothetical protein P170DRAFT_439708 [Aspergillus steynii IBT 23096]|uniref:Uncharacterized protein n=1 Tax=Aspergillus steynii IBT 23096 TaxID=1392250 RepID=A0A2I2FZF4_9EURO|nr:uncharacterized protein P170DRAFT_439708 [Aspergillus steynii IBT 23096]PLB46019.1 hypothetical protein P170DRAFT_439708 [Aspergillus steynii IBT 23096]
MIGPEDRWRGGRPYDHNRQSGQRHPNARNMNMHGGARGGQNQNPHQNPNQNQSQNPNARGAGDSRDQLSAAGLSQDQHVPVRGFNAAEAKGALRRGPGAPRPFFYKTPGKDANNRSGGPWGSKPNSMASGKDFFLELRKQVTTLKQGGNVAGG